MLQTKRLPRLIALVLVLGLLAGLLAAPALAADNAPGFRDVPQTAWYYASVRAAYEQYLACREEVYGEKAKPRPVTLIVSLSSDSSMVMVKSLSSTRSISP